MAEQELERAEEVLERAADTLRDEKAGVAEDIATAGERTGDRLVEAGETLRDDLRGLADRISPAPKRPPKEDGGRKPDEDGAGEDTPAGDGEAVSEKGAGAIRASLVIIRNQLERIENALEPGEKPPPPPPPDDAALIRLIDDYFASQQTPFSVQSAIAGEDDEVQQAHAAFAQVKAGELDYAEALAQATTYKPLAQSAIIPAFREVGLKAKYALACLEKETMARDVFGADWGRIKVDQVPFSWLPVTRERLDALIAHIKGGGQANGVGIAAVTYGPFVIEMDKMANGGGVNPYNQAVKGFTILHDLIVQYGPLEGAARFNAGNNWRIGVSYARDFLAKAEAWGKRLGEGETKPPPGKVLSHGVVDGTNFAQGYKYIIQLNHQMPYEIWYSGPIPPGPMAYGINQPLPPVEQLRHKTIFCAGVANVMRRAAHKIIPTRGNPNWDGGVGCYWYTAVDGLGPGFFAGYTKPFDMATAKKWARESGSGVLIGRSYRGAALGQQGHVAVLLPDGKVLQSIMYEADGSPGLNDDRTIEASNSGGYYEHMVHPDDWINHDKNNF